MTTSTTDLSDPRPDTTLPPLGPTVLGFPRIGRDRELKTALERFWAGDLDADAVRTVQREIRADARATMTHAGLASVPVGVSSAYDHVLDTIALLGAIPQRYVDAAGPDADPLAVSSLAARGGADVAPLELTKWFDTNYHYLVPEIGPDTPIVLQPDDLLAEVTEAVADGVAARPVLVGPATFLLLAKAAPGSPEDFSPLDRLDDVVAAYAELLPRLRAAGASWVQLDEPAFVLDRSAAQIERLGAALRTLSAVTDRPRLLVTAPYGRWEDALGVVAGSGVDAVGVDLVAGELPGPADLQALRDAGVRLLAGAVNGRNVWRLTPGQARRTLATLQSLVSAVGDVEVSSSCSLLHLPYRAARETQLPTELQHRLAFADEKLAEVAALAVALAEGSTDTDAADTPGSPVDAAVRRRVEHLVDDDAQREPAEARRAAQAERTPLPVLPTTTIGSFPQTAEIRRARSQFRTGALNEAAYRDRMQKEITSVVRLQEEIGLDVLVHGEPERNDMVQYFAENLDGFVTTQHGWVQSYGTRCVRPPILHGDVSRPAPITVDWATFAQSLTDRPVKGMLTGPVTILAWSFVREDQPLAETALQVALALRDETVDLEAAGIAVVQVDEPALRELLPPREADHEAYRDWSVRAFRVATSGVATSTQVHTHLCYSEFNEIVTVIDALGADVTSIEASRSRMEVLPELTRRGFSRGVGPGVYDIHSPRVPSAAEVEENLRLAVDAVDPRSVWVNPDCGLKTRAYAEVEPSLRHLVEAAATVRASLA